MPGLESTESTSISLRKGDAAQSHATLHVKWHGTAPHQGAFYPARMYPKVDILRPVSRSYVTNVGHCMVVS